MSDQAFNDWYERYFDEAIEKYAGLDTTNPKGIAQDAWDAAIEADRKRRGDSVKVPEGYVLIAEDYLEVMIGPERMDHLRRACRFPVTKHTPNTQPAEPVAWRVHPFDYGVGYEGVYALTSRPDQAVAWERKGWEVQPLFTTPQPA